jgi:hypothetical protein
MLLFAHRHGERYIIHAVELDAEGGFRVNIQLLRILPGGESGIDDSSDRWPRGGRWFDEAALAHNYQPLGYFNQISPYPRFRQPEARRSSLSDAVKMFGNVLGGMGLAISGDASDVPKAPPPRTAFERILDDEEDD